MIKSAINKNARRRIYGCLGPVLLATILAGILCPLKVAAQTENISGPLAVAVNPADKENTAKSAAQDFVTTQIAVQDRKVTLTVNIKKDSQVSSGRIIVHYPQDLLSLTGAKAGNLWNLEDVNMGLSEHGQSALSLAWADENKRTQEGTMLTVTWEAKDAASGKEIAVETEIAELYSQEEKLAVKPEWIIDRLRPSFAVAGAAGQNGNAVRTGDNANAAGLGLLCLLSVLVMARQIYSKLSNCYMRR